MADQGSEGMLSPFLRKQRLNIVKPYLEGKILDVGCGAGLLADEIQKEQYLGVEIDPLSLKKATCNFPDHQFQMSFPNESEKFDTIVSLAVIEHVKDPRKFLANLLRRLSDNDSARIIITTPHPSMDWIHDLGASVGLFSKHANEEHEELLDRNKLESVGANAGLRLVLYRRFLFGANQLAIFEHKT